MKKAVNLLRWQAEFRLGGLGYVTPAYSGDLVRKIEIYF